MDRKTQMNGNGVNDHPAREAARNAADVWQHALTLGELQTRLLLVEVRAMMERARMAALLVVCGGMLVVASLPVVLACLALVLAEQTQMSPATAFGIVSGAAVFLSGVLMVVGWRQLHQNASGVPRSREEWRLNWTWFKETLRHERREQTVDQAAAKWRD